MRSGKWEVGKACSENDLVGGGDCLLGGASTEPRGPGACSENDLYGGGRVGLLVGSEGGVVGLILSREYRKLGA